MSACRVVAAVVGAVALVVVPGVVIGPGTAVAAPASQLAPADEVRDAQYWLDGNGIRSAWATTRGAGQTIAVIDTGIADGVADLAGAVVGGTDFSGSGSSDGRTPVGDSAEHGTLVASLAAGRGTGSGAGVIGAAPEASLLSISIAFGADSDEQIAQAVIWAVDNGADVINMSLTRNTLEWPTSWDEAFLYAADHDVVVVVAAGNRGSGTTQVGAPATMPGVLTVGGVDRRGVASFDASSQGITIGVSAPSEQLVGVRPDGAYVRWQGTSGATPIVAGVVALVRAAHPELDTANIINRVLATARDAGTAGVDVNYGHGILDAAAAVRGEVPLVEANPLGELREWIQLHRRQDAVIVSRPDRSARPPAREAPVIASPVGVWLPSLVTLQLVGLPWLLTALLAFIAGGTLTGFALHFRQPRARD